MNVYQSYKPIIYRAVKAAFPTASSARISVSAPKDFAHGDLTTNAALALANEVGAPAPVVAARLADALKTYSDFKDVQVAGGYVNVTLADSAWQKFLAGLLSSTPEAFGESSMGAGEKYNVEFVSANPTGPIHLGHVRGAIFGDVLANLLSKAGYEVTKEYYINDHGVQVGKLARSLYLRYEEQITGKPAEIPEGYYPGEYMIDVAKALVKRDGGRWIGRYDETIFRDFAVARIMDMIKGDVARMGISMDVYSSENALYSSGKVDEAVKFMEAQGLTYRGVLEPPKGKTPDDWEPKEQLLFKASGFGDDVDRPLVKSDGESTYFLSDIAYHLDKFRRGFAKQHDVWGADHAGYVKRLEAAVKAVTDGRARFMVSLMQMVRVMKDGRPFKMSKRAGTFIMVEDLLEEITKDELRFYMLTRKNDAQMAFDLTKVKEQSKDNLAFYVQYAHARAASVLRRNPKVAAKADVARLVAEPERRLLQRLALWPVVVEDAAASCEPHRITGYLNDLATAFHALWTAGNRDPSLRFAVEGDPDLTAARLGLVRATKTALASALCVLGVTPVESMESGAEV